MNHWYVTYAGAMDLRKTFEVDADTKAEAMALGDTRAGAWLRLQGMVPGDLRGTLEEGACAQLAGCRPAPPAWVALFGRRDSARDFARVSTAPTATALLDHHGEVPAPWRSTEDLPVRLDLRNHSPTGFEWGYMGSGPAQLAIAACAFALGDERAERVYQRVKERLFAGIQSSEWVVTVARLRALAEDLERENLAPTKGGTA